MGSFNFFKKSKSNSVIINTKEHDLTNDQLLKGKEYYNRHKMFVDRCVGVEVHTYPPTENEDKNNPKLWKPSHWRWFLKYGEKEIK